MGAEFNWTSASPSAADQQLIDAYLAVGVTLDDLPYSAAFDDLLKRLREEDTVDARHSIWKRLLYLRKQALLPRLGRPDARARSA